MTVAEAIARYLVDQGVTDAFGIPGGVVIELLYALEAQDGITPHLSYHEQAAGFAACGYAQVSGKLGVAYATKGPGFTNLITAIADAYYDSIPVLFLTSHSQAALPKQARTLVDQEMDSCTMVRQITKYACRIDTLAELAPAMQKACHAAQNGRKGPVFLDIKAGLFKQEMHEIPPASPEILPDTAARARDIGRLIQSSKRPLMLIGDGINQAGVQDLFNQWLAQVRIPVVSSRYAHNVVKDKSLYFGYVGSHGIRYANYALAKADCVLALGNRLAFPEKSTSYSPIVKQTTIVRCEVDEAEFERHTTLTKNYHTHLEHLIQTLLREDSRRGEHEKWIKTCGDLRSALHDYDCPKVVTDIERILVQLPRDIALVCDVGNNEFWVSRACVHVGVTNRTLYSKSFGALGSALCKAIGAYYATHRPVAAFIGDQGMQLNIQELQYIAQHQLPITIILLNNASSGMILDRERAMGHKAPLHTTAESGYIAPDFAAIAKGYGISHLFYHGNNAPLPSPPLLLEMNVDKATSLTPSLPTDARIQDMVPQIDARTRMLLDIT